MKMNSLDWFKVMVLGLVFSLSSVIWAQQSVTTTSAATQESMPKYNALKMQFTELPAIADKYTDQIKICKKLSDDLADSIKVSSSTGVLVSKSKTLDACGHLARLILIRFAEISTDIFRVRNSTSDSIRFGWTDDQLAEASHWYEKMNDLLEKIQRTQIKYVSPDEIEILLKRAEALCNARLVFYTPVFFDGAP